MNWYLEIEVYHDTEEWNVLLMTLIFEDAFKRIDEYLQEVKAVIFRIRQELMEWVKPD